jgi:hypothetical protein
VLQITHEAITKNKRNQVIVTMHASNLKMNTRTKYMELGDVVAPDPSWSREASSRAVVACGSAWAHGFPFVLG